METHSSRSTAVNVSRCVVLRTVPGLRLDLNKLRFQCNGPCTVHGILFLVRKRDNDERGLSSSLYLHTGSRKSSCGRKERGCASGEGGR